MSTKNTQLLRPTQSGFSLLEVMIAVVIIGFGVIAIGKFFSVSMLNSGFVHQQTIALSLADSKIEDLRAYDSLTTYNAISTSTELDGVYTISSTINPIASAGSLGAYKEIAVTVAWTDLLNQPQTITSTSVIGSNDPKSIAYLLKNHTPQDNQVHPFNRVLKVPIPAINQNDGTSIYSPPGADISISLDNTSGDIVGGSIVPDTIADDTAYYLLSGYISFGSGSTDPSTDAERNIDIILNITASDYDCWDDSHLPPDAKAYPGFITYSCIIKGFGAGDPVWSGTIRMELDTSGVVVDLSTVDNICRFDNTLASYTDISETLANQNFIIIKSTRSCDSGTTAF
jgi:prepilin-type N-terminal cleavage/methylation domain-containing protein